MDVAKSKKIITILENCTLSIANDANKNSQGNAVPCVSEKLFLLSFPDTALTYFLQRQTNRVLRKLGGLRKNTYRDLTFRTCSEEEVELLENCQETKEILAKLDRQSVGLIESGEFLHFFHTEYSGRLDTSTLQIEKTSLLLHPHSMLPKWHTNSNNLPNKNLIPYSSCFRRSPVIFNFNGTVAQHPPFIHPSILCSFQFPIYSN